jgi:two-component system, LytTR family, sensor kinase
MMIQEGQELHQIADWLNKVRSRNLIYLVHFIFWALYFGFLTFFGTQLLPLYYAIQRNLLIVSFNAMVFYLNFLWIMPAYFERGNLRSYGLSMLGIMLLAAPIQYVIEVTFFAVPEEVKVYTYNMRYVSLIAVACFIFLLVSTLLRMAVNRYKFQRELLELKANKFEAELKFLREQINPHFLFNSINNIYSLSLDNSPKTPEMILKLSELLRYMLYDCNQPTVELDNELKCISSLIELFQLKYSTPIHVSLDIQGDTGGRRVVPNLFTPIVENAFKHGDFNTNPQAYMAILCKVSDGLIHFSVRNSKSPTKPNRSSPGGIGLKNLKRRFKINYEQTGRIDIVDKQDVYMVEMKIPLTIKPIA